MAGLRHSGAWKFDTRELDNGWHAISLYAGTCRMGPGFEGLPLWAVCATEGQIVAARDLRRWLAMVGWESNTAGQHLAWWPGKLCAIQRIQGAIRIAEDDGSFNWSKCKLELQGELGTWVQGLWTPVYPDKPTPHGMYMVIEYVIPEA